MVKENTIKNSGERCVEVDGEALAPSQMTLKQLRVPLS